MALAKLSDEVKAFGEQAKQRIGNEFNERLEVAKKYGISAKSSLTTHVDELKQQIAGRLAERLKGAQDYFARRSGH
jgi:hypothetical protein